MTNSFQAKIGWKRMGKKENKKLSFRFVSTRCLIENSKKITKKSKKLKNSITASFQAKIGWKMMRQIENKNYSSVSSLPAVKHKIPKKYQKNSKN